ncbi:MAG TPA: ferrochelatase [Cyclobacteriaceae bacterium]
MQGILLVNLGTPNSYQVKDLRKYLREFLMDGRVIDIPAFPRWLLVNLIIAPFRAPKVAKEYKKLWTENGSPLFYYGRQVKKKLQERLGSECHVELAMRYQNPSIAEGLQMLKDKKVKSIRVVSLFPQYASATTGSVSDKVMEIVRTWQVIPSVAFVNQYHDHPKFIQAFVENGKKHLENNKYDHVIFSYHGLPERHLRKLGKDYNHCSYPDCKASCAEGKPENDYCYRSACFQTSNLIAEQLGLKTEEYTVCFQSRLGKDPWIQPYTEDVVNDLNKHGKKKVLAYSPAFVADCLETTLEVGEQYKEQFMEGGGEEWQLVESLNESETWIDCLEDLVRSPQVMEADRLNA